MVLTDADSMGCCKRFLSRTGLTTCSTDTQPSCIVSHPCLWLVLPNFPTPHPQVMMYSRSLVVVGRWDRVLCSWDRCPRTSSNAQPPLAAQFQGQQGAAAGPACFVLLFVIRLPFPHQGA